MRLIIRYSLSLLLGAVWQASLAASQSDDVPEKQNIDKNAVNQEEAAKKACANVKPITKRLDCLDSYHKKQVSAGDVRGTKEYCRKHYVPLQTQALKSKFNDLKSLAETARPSDPINHAQGELNKETYEIELDCIRWELNRREPGKLLM